MNQTKTSTATFAGGCFWCTEAVFKRLKGATEVIPGYTGGTVPNPTYEQICSGNTGHAEAIQITFDPSIISYETLLSVFFATHDPTTLNRQGADRGTQYRSAIFYHDGQQKKVAQKVIADLERAKKYQSPIVTQVVSTTTFYPAQEYHRQYYEKNKLLNPYCRIVIDPKITKLYKEFGALAKKE